MATPSPRIEKILVPYDFGEPAARALTYARILVERLSASLELLHVVADLRLALLPLGPAEGGAYVPSPGLLDEITREGEAALDEVLTAHDRKALRATRRVVVGDARAQIIGQARLDGADLIVMGTHGRSGVRHALLGSVAEGVVRAAACPVLTVR